MNDAVAVQPAAVASIQSSPSVHAPSSSSRERSPGSAMSAVWGSSTAPSSSSGRSGRSGSGASKSSSSSASTSAMAASVPA